jgi:predicted nucleic acid-binding protein
MIPNKPKSLKKTVFFNASVILAGLNSPEGGSGTLLKWSKNRIIESIVSEIVLDEVIRNANNIDLNREHIRLLMRSIFERVVKPPGNESVYTYQQTVIDLGDAHLFASCYETKADFLVSLDKKHVLALQNEITWIKIVSPKELIEKLRQ